MASASPPSVVDASFESMKLQVGARLQVSQRQMGRDTIYYSSLVGYVLNEFLLLRLPQENGMSVPMREGETLMVRVFCGLCVYSFTCEIETVFLTPRNYMHLSWPKSIKALALRKAMRVRVEIPVMVNSNATAVLSDLSVTGAQLTAESPLAQVGERMSVEFSFNIKPTNQEVKMQIDATVRSVKQRIGRAGDPVLVDHGIFFEGLGGNEVVMLQNYVYELLLENKGL